MSTPITQAALDAFKRRVVFRGSTESDLIEGLTELVASMARLECALAIERSTLAGALEIKRGFERELHESRNAERLARVQLGNEREKVRTLREACERVVEQWDKNHDAAPIHAGSVMYSRANAALTATEDTQ